MIFGSPDDEAAIVLQAEKETLRVQFSFIRNGERIYTFSALSKAINYGRRAPEFGRIVDSFQELRDPARPVTSRLPG